MTADRRVDGAAGGHHAATHGLVLAMDLARFQHAHEGGVRLQGPRDHEQPAGVLVQPVDNAGPWQQGQPGIVGQQGVLQRPVRVAGAGVDDQPDRLVDDDQGGVLVDDLERHWLGHDRHLVLEPCVDLHRLAADEAVAGTQRTAVDEHLALVDPGLQARPGIVRKQAGKRLVEAPAGRFGGHAC